MQPERRTQPKDQTCINRPRVKYWVEPRRAMLANTTEQRDLRVHCLVRYLETDPKHFCGDGKRSDGQVCRPEGKGGEKERREMMEGGKRK